MKNPQTKAETIGKWGCLAFCYLYCIGYKDVSDGQLIKMVSDAIDQGIIDKDCTVNNARNFIKFFTNKNCFVDKQPIKEISKIKDATPVLYSMDGGKSGHFVVVENGKIVYNPLSYSRNVEKGVPISARFITVCS